MHKFKILRIFNIATLIALGIILITPSISYAQRMIKDTPENSLEILKYEWKYGGTGTEAVLKSITIHNRGKKNYENISLEVDLYSYSDVPHGSIQAVINDSIAGGTTKTFENVNFGLMNTELEKTVFRVTGADQLRDGEIPAADLILVKDWEWGPTYGTEGILKYITLENRSSKSYKDIVLTVKSFRAGQKKTIPVNAVIKDVLPANSVQTYKDINVGFRYTGAGNTLINVVNAKRVSNRELRYRMAKKGVKIDTELMPDAEEFEGSTGLEDRNLTLAQRYRKDVLKIDPESGKSLDADIKEEEISPSVDTQEVIGEDYTYLNEPQRYNTRVDNALTADQMLREEARIFPEVFKEIVIVSANADETEPMEAPTEIQREEYVQEKPIYTSPKQGEKNNIFKRAVNWSKDLVGLSDDEYDEDEYYVEEEVAVKQQTPSTGNHPYTDVEKYNQANQESIENIGDYKLDGDEYQEPIPSIDIQVTDYKLESAITNTVASFKEITLINSSRITYTNIQLEATSYAWTDRRPLGSYNFTINEILPRRSKRTFRNVRMGFLSAEPQNLKIRIIDAISVN